MLLVVEVVVVVVVIVIVLKTMAIILNVPTLGFKQMLKHNDQLPKDGEDLDFKSGKNMAQIPSRRAHKAVIVHAILEFEY